GVGRDRGEGWGSLSCRELTPGGGYLVRDAWTGSTSPATVLSFKDRPDPSLYTRQSLREGLQYIEMRDGTLLAATVRPPLGKRMSDGPFPTVVEYSGYATADPAAAQPVSQLAGALRDAAVGADIGG